MRKLCVLPLAAALLLAGCARQNRLDASGVEVDWLEQTVGIETISSMPTAPAETRPETVTTMQTERTEHRPLPRRQSRKPLQSRRRQNRNRGKWSSPGHPGCGRPP